jgi:hypothetical protein
MRQQIRNDHRGRLRSGRTVGRNIVRRFVFEYASVATPSGHSTNCCGWIVRESGGLRSFNEVRCAGRVLTCLIVGLIKMAAKTAPTLAFVSLVLVGTCEQCRFTISISQPPTAINALFQMEEEELYVDSRCFIHLLVEQPSEGAQTLRAKSWNLNLMITICRFKIAKMAQKNLRTFLKVLPTDGH